MINRNIKEKRQQLGISQRELARRINMSGQMISKIERGETTPSIETLNKIAEALKVPVSSFFDMDNIQSDHYDSEMNKIEQIIDADKTINKINNATEFQSIKRAIENLSYCIISYFNFKNIFLDEHTAKFLQQAISKDISELIGGLDNRFQSIENKKE